MEKISDPLCNGIRRFKNAIKKAHELQNANLNSDHILLTAEVKVVLKKIKGTKKVNEWDLDKTASVGKDMLGES